MYHSEEPRAFKNIRKNRLGVLWRSNHKAWVTRSLFSDWVTVVFDSTVCEYLREKDLPLKVLLITDNAPAHSHNLMEELPDGFSFIKFHFLPPNTTPLLQPTDQFKIKIKKKNLKNSALRHCLGNVLRPLLPGCDSEGLLEESLKYSGYCFLNCGSLEGGFCWVIEIGLEANLA